MTFEDRIEAALAAPVAPPLQRALDLRVRAAIDLTPRRRRGVSITRVLVLAGLLALALPGVIIGGKYLSENPFGLADANEFAQEIAVAKTQVPLPPGRTWPAFFRMDDPSANYGRGGGLAWAESIATCLWLDEWLEARAAGDAAREAAAASTIAAIPTWTDWNSLHFDQSYRDYVGSIIAAVARADDGPAKQNAEINCAFATE